MDRRDATGTIDSSVPASSVAVSAHVQGERWSRRALFAWGLVLVPPLSIHGFIILDIVVNGLSLGLFGLPSLTAYDYAFFLVLAASTIAVPVGIMNAAVELRRPPRGSGVRGRRLAIATIAIGIVSVTIVAIRDVDAVQMILWRRDVLGYFG